MTACTPPLSGKKGLVVGLANDRSIAWGCAQTARAQGADLVLSCLNDKAARYVAPLADQLASPLFTCDVEKDGDLEALVAAYNEPAKYFTTR